MARAPAPGTTAARRPASRARRERTPRRIRLGGATFPLAAVLLLWSGTGWLDSSWAGVTYPAAVSLVVSVLALPVIAVAVSRRYWIPAAVAALAAALPWVPVAGDGTAGPGPAAAGRQPLRLLLVDADGGGANATGVAGLVRRDGADVLVVTGLTAGLAHDLTVAGVDARVNARWLAPDASLGIWTRPDLPLTGVRPLAGVVRPAAVGTLGTPSGPVTLVVGSAGDPASGPIGSGAAWRREVAALGAAASPPGPRIVAADLAATPWQPAFRRLSSRGWRDAADVAGHGLRPTWPAVLAIPIAPLDHVLVAGDLGVAAADTATVAGAGHRALLATITLPVARGD